MSAIDPNTKEVQHGHQTPGFLILAAAAFIVHSTLSIVSNTSSNIAHCYQSRMIEYEDYLDCNFDGTRDSTNPLAQAYVASKANNEVNTLKEMLKDPDHLEFLKAILFEVQSLFDE